MVIDTFDFLETQSLNDSIAAEMDSSDPPFDIERVSNLTNRSSLA
jgi:hypothetical protein